MTTIFKAINIARCIGLKIESRIIICKQTHAKKVGVAEKTVFGEAETFPELE